MSGERNTSPAAINTALPGETQKEKKEILFHGIPVSPGIAIGSVLLTIAGEDLLSSGIPPRNIAPEDAPEEVAFFRASLEKTREEINELIVRARNTVNAADAEIFDAHSLIVDDRMLMNEVTSAINRKCLSAESAFRQTINKYISAISAIPDLYLKERASDVEDVAHRILRHLCGVKSSLEQLPGPRIVVGKDMTPSDTVMLDRDHVLAFAIEAGSRTCHSAILARSMKIPALVGMSDFYASLQNGDTLIIDGFLGLAVLNPTKETLEYYRKKQEESWQLDRELMQEHLLQSITPDGVSIKLEANVGGADDWTDLQKYGIRGIGLFRTEYLYMNRNTFPTEEEQYEVYKKAAKSVGKEGAVIIRTLDIGGDKNSVLFEISPEQNPFLGLRAIRLCMERPEILKTQMRAILRAGTTGNIKLMFPMVSGVKELDRLLLFLEETKDSLRKEGIPFDENMKAGVMIEVPSAALSAHHLAKKADFFSIGTNDLVQYTLAVDRNNEKVAHLYEPAHPAVLSLIARSVDAAEKQNIPVGVCGESAGDLLTIPILLGLGVRELSMSPISIGQCRRLIRQIPMKKMQLLAQQVLELETGEAVLGAVTRFLTENAPDLLRRN